MVRGKVIVELIKVIGIVLVGVFLVFVGCFWEVYYW